jgi:hypothetical protein
VCWRRAERQNILSIVSYFHSRRRGQHELGHEAQAGRDFALGAAATLNAEKTFSIFFPPQWGQAEGTSRAVFKRCSKRREHFLHSYS